MAKTWPCLPSRCTMRRAALYPSRTSEVTFSKRVSGKRTADRHRQRRPHTQNQEPDKGTARKAFCGLCMAIVQSDKSGGNITVEAASPGLESRRRRHHRCRRPATLRPQVGAWEREVPTGFWNPLAGLWRPIPNTQAQQPIHSPRSPETTPQSSLLRQNGSGSLDGVVEGGGGGVFGGSDAGAKIEEGKVERQQRYVQGRARARMREEPSRMTALNFNERRRQRAFHHRTSQRHLGHGRRSGLHRMDRIHQEIPTCAYPRPRRWFCIEFSAIERGEECALMAIGFFCADRQRRPTASKIWRNKRQSAATGMIGLQWSSNLFHLKPGCSRNLSPAGTSTR